MKKLLLITLVLISMNSIAQKRWMQTGNATSKFEVSGSILAMCKDAAGNIYVTGVMQNAKGKYYVSKWDGTTWSELATDSLKINQYGLTLCSDPSGNIYMGGYFTDSSKAYVVKWNGTTWSRLGDLSGSNSINADNSIVNSLCSDTFGNVYCVHGGARLIGGKYYWDVYKWNGSNWSIVGGDTAGMRANYTPYTVTCDQAGNIYAAGRFKNDSGSMFVSKWNGTKWEELGKGGNELKANEVIWRLHADKAGNIYAGGRFTNKYGKVYVAKWDGTKWNALGTDSSFENANASKNLNQVLGIETDDAGQVYIAGAFQNSSMAYYIAVYDGTSWGQLGTTGFNGGTNAILYTSKDEIYTGGSFTDMISNKNYVATYGIALGLNKVSASNNYNVFPNPAKEYITISIDPLYTGAPYQIIDITGRNIAGGKLNGATNMINIENLTQGIYFIQVKSESHEQNIKFV